MKNLFYSSLLFGITNVASADFNRTYSFDFGKSIPAKKDPSENPRNYAKAILFRDEENGYDNWRRDVPGLKIKPMVDKPPREKRAGLELLRRLTKPKGAWMDHGKMHDNNPGKGIRWKIQ
jgi:hypothetical protein